VRVIALAVMALGVALLLLGLTRFRRRPSPAASAPPEPVEFPVGFEVAPILALDQVAPGQPYRRKDDPDYVVRFRSEQPDGLRRRVAEEVPAAGISRADLPVWLFIAGRERQLELERAPGVLAGHPEAIRIWGHWVDDEGQAHREALGWLPPDVAVKLARDPEARELAAVPRALVIPGDDRVPAVFLDVWTNLGSQRR
jgi:hypothetical protein